MRPSTQTSSVALLSGLLRHAKWLEGIGDSEHARHVRARAMSVSYTLDQRADHTSSRLPSPLELCT